MKHAFWKRLKDWSERHREEAWMRERGHDRRCTRCRTWFSDSGTWEQITRTYSDPDFEIIVCANCNEPTVWDCRYMIPFPADDPALLKRAAEMPLL